MSTQDTLDKAHTTWAESRFDGTDKSHAEQVLDTLAGFLDLPVIEAKESAWGGE